MNIYFGTIERYIDITEKCKELICENILTIPNNNLIRTKLFGEPGIDLMKKIYIKKQNSSCETFEIFEYDENTIILINIINGNIECLNVEEFIIKNKLYRLHNKLKLDFGSFNEELNEQIITIKYLSGNEKVLEIGGNIGRNSLIIASILKENNNNNFVVLESDNEIAKQLEHNRNLNNFNFYIENSAISKNKLIQKNWNTIESNNLIEGFKKINNISYKELIDKYNIIFDTLILDCEGGFFYILRDFPEILNNINLIIMENDYFDYNKKIFIDEILKINNFNLIYNEKGGWGPCYDVFYQVWKKTA